MPIAWSDDYSTGNPDIDEQHKQLFQYLADLEEHMAGGADEAYVKRFLDMLGLYTRSHFCFEEICMRRSKCPVAEKNKEQHRKLLDTYRLYRERFEREGVSEDLLEKLHAFLESWLVNHILRIDTHLRNCGNAR
jgi:hemerythrin-like metal-binding protein